jgi:hypothetical protein
MNAIIVRRTSWHYRLYRFVHDPRPGWVRRVLFEEYGPRKSPDPKALCGYFWLVALSPLIILGAWLVGLVISIIFGPIVGVIFVVGLLVDRFRRGVAEKIARGETPKTTIAASYVKARKARVCPRVVLR